MPAGTFGTSSMAEENKKDNLLSALGPGLLWAGTAVGVSHLVQSTRAGAGYGMTLLLVILTANLLKYPAFEAAPRYTSATGKSLLQAYREQGKWALILFLCVTIGTMFTVLGAVTIVTAGMASILVPDGPSTTEWSAMLLVGAGVLLASGKFKALEGLMKILMLVLTVSTLMAIVMLLGQVDISTIPWWPPLPELSATNVFFIVALVGWMPSAIDISVWQSLWSLEKARTEKKALTVKGSSFDFRVGYFGTVFLALCFVFLGASVLYGSGQELPKSGGAFAAKFVGMYVGVLGEWSRPVVMVAAFSTMLSTTITVSDGFPRALEAAIARLSSDEEEMGERTKVYWGALVFVGAGALLIISNFASDLRALVDLATTLSFLTAPVLAWLNYRAVTSDRMPEERRPKGAYAALHIIGIVCMAMLAGYFLYMKAIS